MVMATIAHLDTVATKQDASQEECNTDIDVSYECMHGETSLRAHPYSKKISCGPAMKWVCDLKSRF